MNRGECWSPEDGVVLQGPIDDLEFDLLLSEVCGGAEDDIQVYQPQRVRRLPWDDSVERGLCQQEIVHRDFDLSQCVRVDEVYAASSIREHFFGGKTSYLHFKD
jgi:hypothetical protein